MQKCGKREADHEVISRNAAHYSPLQGYTYNNNNNDNEGLNEEGGEVPLPMMMSIVFVHLRNIVQVFFLS